MVPGDGHVPLDMPGRRRRTFPIEPRTETPILNAYQPKAFSDPTQTPNQCNTYSNSYGSSITGLTVREGIVDKGIVY